MLCSECSKPVKPVVAIDIDGTLGDYHGQLLDFAEAYLNVSKGRRPAWRPDQYDGTRNFGDWFCGMYQVSRDTYRQIKLAYRQGGIKRWMPVYDGAAALANNCIAHNIEVWITTTRPYNRLDSVDPDTRAWLKFNGIEFDHLLYDDNKYEKLGEYVERERVIAVLDDLPEMYDAATQFLGPEVPILRKTEWNRGVRRMRELDDLESALLIIMSRAYRWERKNGI